MPRPPRVHIDEGLYFVTSAGEYNRELFRDNGDRFHYLELVGRYKTQHQFKLFSYVLMATFVHLLIELGKTSTISDIMHDINSSYTKYYNGRYDKTGHLFGGRYQAAVIEKERYLLELTRYIHLVPKEEDYEWSSYPAYKTAEKAGLADTKEVLKSFAQGDNEARKLYMDFMANVQKSELVALEKRLAKETFLGSKEFIEKMKKAMDAAETKNREARKEEITRARRRIIAVAVIAVLIISGGGYLYFLKKATLREKGAEKKYQEGLDAYYKKLSRTLEIERQKAKALEEKLLGEGEKK